MSDPYVIEAKDFDPEKHERPLYSPSDELSWVSRPYEPMAFPPNFPIVVRDRPSCRSAVPLDTGTDALHVRCQLSLDHDGYHKFEFKSFVGEWP